VNDNGQLPVWQPGDQLPAWAKKLQEPFPPAEVGLRPQVWCPKCRDEKIGGKLKFCGMPAGEKGSGGVEHVRKKCRDCGQNITQAHLHLSYIGHAHITDRLLATDPKWTWRPMGRDIPEEVMTAAIATGNLAIIQTVISAYPPKIIEVPGPNGRVEHIMWGEVIIHDENGDEFAMPGVGDAIGKSWDPNAVKEMLGDLFRNALMRHGAGLDLWKKQDADQAKRERNAAGADDPGGYSARAAIFDQAGEGSQEQPASGRPAARKPRETPPDTGTAGINPEAQAAADLAWKLRTDQVTVEELRLKAYEPALKNKLLGDKHGVQMHCLAPWDREQKTTVIKVIGRARQELEAHHAAQPAAQG
jgi:hypothetical protein